MQKTQHNKAKKDKMSILADAKELLRVLIPAVQHLPKIERIEGAPMEMKKAAFGLIDNFHIAHACPECREEYIRRMIGRYGVLQAAFELAILAGLFTDGERLGIAMAMERIEEGVGRWHKALRSAPRRVRGQVGSPEGDQEDCGST